MHFVDKIMNTLLLSWVPHSASQGGVAFEFSFQVCSRAMCWHELEISSQPCHSIMSRAWKYAIRRSMMNNILLKPVRPLRLFSAFNL
jgi:hypothetical protein